MSKKKLWIIIGALVLVVVAVLVVLLCCNSKPAEEPEPEVPTEQTEDARTVGSSQEPEKTPDETASEEAPESAQILESEGDLIITIPDDEESDGF